MEICPLTPAICDRVARFHLLYLSTPFRGFAGQKLLRQYYQTVCGGKGAFGYIALQEDDLLGYVCGVWDAKELQKTLLQNRWLSLVLWGALQVLVSPSLLIEFLKRFHTRTLIEPGLDEKNDLDSYELRPLVVSPTMRGSGLALQLVERLQEDASLRGHQTIYLYAERDNLPALRFYQKAGFSEVSTSGLNGRQVVRFEMYLNKAGTNT